MQHIYKNIEEHKPSRKWNVLIVYDNMITNMISNIKRCPIVTEPLIKGRKLNISSVYQTMLFLSTWRR